MSSLDTNYGMQSLAIAIGKQARESNAEISLALLNGAVAQAEQIQAHAPAAAPAPQVQAPPVPEGPLGANVDTYA